MESDLNTRIKSEKKLNQSLRFLGVPAWIGVILVGICIVSIDPLREYSLLVIIPVFFVLRSIRKAYKNGNDHYIRRLLIKKHTDKKLYKDQERILFNLIKEKDE